MFEDGIRRAMGLTPEEADALFENIVAAPDDLEQRVVAACYECHPPPGHAPRGYENLTWLVEHHASHPELNFVFGSSVQIRGAALFELHALWCEALERSEEDLALLANAAAFFRFTDEDRALDCFRAAEALEPESPRWPREIGSLIHRRATHRRLAGGTPGIEALAARALAHFERALSLSMNRQERVLVLEAAADVAFLCGDTEAAKSHARECLEAAGEIPANWQTGNLIYSGHTVLGRLALRSGELELAEKHLLRAAETPGSPQLDSFGPDCTLAAELLEAGRTEAVLRFLDRIGRRSQLVKDRTEYWTHQIEQGKTPSFDRFRP